MTAVKMTMYGQEDSMIQWPSVVAVCGQSGPIEHRGPFAFAMNALECTFI